MLDVVLPLAFLLISWVIGQAFYKHFLEPVGVSCFLAPALGVAVLIIFTSYAYQFGLKPSQIGLVICVFSMVALLSLVFPMESKFSISKLRTIFITNCRVVSILVVGYILLVLPALLGGLNFKIFQGNHWDSLSYMGISQSVTFHTFSELTSNPDITLYDPVTTIGTSSMRARPNVEILLASFLAPFQLSILDFSYSFAIYLTLVLGCAMWAFYLFFKSKLTVTHSFLIVFLIACFLVGFWGQYYIDVNAWSAAVALPLMMGVFISQSTWLVKSDLWRGVILSIFLVSSILVYPESFLFFCPLILIFSFFTWWRREVNIFQSVYRTIFLYCLVFFLLLTSKYSPLQFGLSQLGFSSGKASAPWGPYFQAYLGGDQGLSYSSGLNFLRTIPSGLMGLYFLSPTQLALSNLKDILTLIVNCIVISVFILLLIKLFKFARTSPIGLMTILGVSFVPMFALVSTLWTAGKAINYMVPFVFLAILVELSSNKFKSNTMKFVASGLLIAWGVCQLGFAVERIQTVSSSYSPHSFPPYISVQNVNLKSKQDWIFPSVNRTGGCKVIELDVKEPFQRYYAQMRLNELRIKWYDKNPINTYFGSGTDVGSMTQISSNGKCIIQNAINRQNSSYGFTLVLKD